MRNCINVSRMHGIHVYEGVSIHSVWPLDVVFSSIRTLVSA